MRCPYCDFAVDTRADIPHDAYADAVIAELAARRAWFAGAGPLASIYFGGGTPGAVAPGRARARASRPCAPAFGAPARRRARDHRRGQPRRGRRGAPARAARRRRQPRRLGAQAFDDRLLRALGRNHDAAAIPVAVRAARAAGFEALSLDLMFGLPEQSLDDWRRALDAAVALAPEHVSAYALTIERGTAFGALDRAGKLPRPDDEATAAMFEDAGAALARRRSAALRGVELRAPRPPRAPQRPLLVGRAAISASAPRRRRFGRSPTARAGASRTRARPIRISRRRAPAPCPARHVERRTAAELENEAVWLGLRTVDGVDRAAHRARYGRDPLEGRDAARGCLAGGVARRR